jgi:hypothetical protein
MTIRTVAPILLQMASQGQHLNVFSTQFLAEGSFF